MGHELIFNHPFAEQRFAQAHENLSAIKKVLENGDLNEFIKITESEALILHAMMMTSMPYFILMKPNTLEIIKLQKLPGSDSVIAKYKAEIARYDKEKADIKAQAEGHEKDYNDINVFDDQFDMTEALLSISIALFGITALTQKKWLFYFAASVSLVGVILGLTAFMHISLHSDFVSGILG